ncbi:MAG: sugar nucleotide-binding protein [Gammaproteobacteria bacterium]|uniref:dTDP-4-dehydrorhamnose reductase n=1 Tax=Marinobacter litoralis TaxID=187981 RepID=A0A3M2RJD2_9GAMM|nr:sugar nucleotide-binding protein [Marinobacter litoralis]MBR9869724.1 sugar nucleotide-binding protein [Gammaproteobacteria bacterium]RMJ05431.1 dTDP-4-dehydrorhamnose reductase [Marinobacter litoralis]
MHVLVVHDYGPLGRVLLDRLRASHLRVSPLLISDPARVDLHALASWIPDDTDLIVNALWLGDPEQAEADREATHEAAFSLPLALAGHALERGMAMLQLSSCYVFDGRKQDAYIASNPGQPINELGRWQWECEQALRSQLPRHIILRAGWSLARIAKKVYENSANTDALPLPGRCLGQPVAVKDLARVMAAIIMQLDCGAEAWGTYQYAGAEEISLYELGLAIADMPGIPEGIRVVDETPEWGHLEPVNTTMVCTKIRNTFGIKQLPWRRWLEEEFLMVTAAEKPESEPVQ